MRRRTSSGIALLVATALITSGCFTTRVASGRPAAGPEYTDRQWFTIGGLVPLSGPGGRECADGFATAESQISFTDFLINLGLSIVAGGVGYAVCSVPAGTSVETEATLRASCAGSGASLIQFLLATRTVRYRCAAGPGMSSVVAPNDPFGITPSR